MGSAGWSAGAWVLLASVLCAMPAMGAHSASGAPPRELVATDRAKVPPGVESQPLPAATSVHLTVVLRPLNASGLVQLDRALAAARSGSPPPFLTETQFVARFSPPPSAVRSVEQYFAGYGGHGFTVTGDRLGVSFDGPSGALAEALGTHFVLLGRTGARPVYTASEAPTLPVAFGSLVAGVGGLSDVEESYLRLAVSSHLPMPRPVGRSIEQYVVDPNSGGEWFLGSDYAQLLNDSSLFPGRSTLPNATFASHEAVATILMSGFNDTTQQDLPPFDPVAVEQYFNDTFPPSWPHPNVSGVPVTVAGVTPPSPGFYNGANDTTLDEEENSLDLEMAGSMAPGASVVNFYFAASVYDGQSSTATVGSLADYFAAALAAALDHNYSGARLAAVTNSYGLPDLNDSLWDIEMLHAEALGVTVVAASGDQGDAPNEVSGRFQGQWPTWPGTAAYNGTGTLAIGGVSLTATGLPEGSFDGTNLTAGFDGNMTGVSSLRTWYETRAGPGNLSGSEGGVSSEYPEPYWQFHSAAQPTIANASAQEGVGALGRSEPDLAFPANATIAYVARDVSGTYFDVLEGTSVASPLFAGMLAEAAAVAGHPFGFLDPELYRMASYFAAHPGPMDPFVDIASGSNFIFTAGPGWDATTGWGLLDPGKFLAIENDSAVRNYQYTGPTPGLPPVPPPILPPQGVTSALSAVVLILVGLLGAVVVVVVILVGRRPKVDAPPPYPPYGTYVPPPPGATGGYVPPPPTTHPFTPGGWTFACPYCGRIRPAEPVPCPSCGRL
ncbi:MAG: S8 family serine peptidase [Thermoplasmata archaeon]|nr:S8 family serine peptidase [Thermoplasmata archaeon]